jgi:hypothetical protein
MTYPNVKRAEPVINKPEKVKITKEEQGEKISKRAFILGMTAIISTAIMIITIVSLSLAFEMVRYMNPQF